MPIITFVVKNNANNTTYSVQEAQSADGIVFNGIGLKVSL